MVEILNLTFFLVESVFSFLRPFFYKFQPKGTENFLMNALYRASFACIMYLTPVPIEYAKKICVAESIQHSLVFSFDQSGVMYSSSPSTAPRVQNLVIRDESPWPLMKIGELLL